MTTADASDVALYNFVVDSDDTKNWGVVGASNYLDWSIIRAEDEHYVLCTLSLAHPVSAALTESGSDDVVVIPSLTTVENEEACVRVSGLDFNRISSNFADLHVEMSNGRSVVFSMARP